MYFFSFLLGKAEVFIKAIMPIFFVIYKLVLMKISKKQTSKQYLKQNCLNECIINASILTICRGQ